jgi:hypothetical protein
MYTRADAGRQHYTIRVSQKLDSRILPLPQRDKADFVADAPTDVHRRHKMYTVVRSP